jgi:tripartite-type tricarboxylate transporter receptor subunit TctC
VTFGRHRRYITNLCFVVSLMSLRAAAVSYAQATDYPNRPVTLISDSAPGSAPDASARFIAEGLSKIWQKQVIVANRPGANGSIAARAASEAAPDGYTIFMPALSTFASLPSVAPNLPVKLPRDFLPIGFAIADPMFIVVNPSLGVTTLPQLITKARKEPDSISIAVTGVGRLSHLTGLLLQQRADIKLLQVPYNGGPAAAIGDVSTGRVSLLIDGYSGLAGAVNAGQVKIMAMAGLQRLPEFPDVPAVAETIPDFAAMGWQVLVAPLGTPAPVINKIGADLTNVVDDPELEKKLGALGAYGRAMTPDQLLAFVNKEQQTWLPLLENISTK